MSPKSAPPPLEEAPAEPVRMFQTRIDLASGRPALLAVPADATDFELLSLVNAIIKVGDKLRAERPAPSPIVPMRAMPGLRPT